MSKDWAYYVVMSIISYPSSRSGSRDWEVDRPHWVWKKPRTELYSSGEYWSIVERLNQQLARMEKESLIKF
jgi:hypothetical protein